MEIHKFEVSRNTLDFEYNDFLGIKRKNRIIVQIQLVLDSHSGNVILLNYSNTDQSRELVSLLWLAVTPLASEILKFEVFSDTSDLEYNGFPKIKRIQHIIVQMEWEPDSYAENLLIHLQANPGLFGEYKS